MSIKTDRIPTFRAEWGQEKKKYFFLSPINSRKGEKKGRTFYPRRYIAASGELLIIKKNPQSVIGIDFFRIIKMRMIFKHKRM